MGERILVVEDDPVCLRLIAHTLEAAGYQVFTAPDGRQGIQQFHMRHPHLVLLDVMMPELDGWDVCRRIREISTVPVIMLTWRQDEDDVVRGLKTGADGYLTKPVQPKALQARVEAFLRRARIPPDEHADQSLRFGDGELLIEPSERRVLVGGQEIHLSPTEYDLLIFFARHPNRVFSNEIILDRVWPLDAEVSVNNIKWYIRQLRIKIEPDPNHPRFLLTERGSGYRFSPL
ncbi:MAG: response regulator transcription factor [Anaerolineae bacterium]|nr:response regulator transcription factor [Anaerolineae bacterium]